MEREFISYEQAVSLKELGFDEMCFGYYSDKSVELMHCKNAEPWMSNVVVAAPLKQQVFRWFREKGCISQILYDNFYNSYAYQIDGEFIYRYDGAFKTYEQAEDACIDKLIELAKQQSISDDTLSKQQDNSHEEYDNIQAGN